MKKIIKDENSPAKVFLSEDTKKKAGQPKAETKPTTNFDAFKVEKKETKSRLLHIALKPSYYKVLEEVAKKSNLSVNETLNQVIKQFFKLED